MKKTLFSFMIILVLFLCLSITSYAEGNEYENIKIGLHFSSSAKDSASLTCYSGFEMGYENESGDFELISALLETDLTINVSEEGFLQVEGIFVNTDFPNLCIRPGFGNLQLDGKDYRGSMIFIKDDNNLMTIINKVGLEEYLYSVLGREMSPSWPIEALKAQAICARTYSINNWRKYASYGFNLDNTQNSQVYSGISSEGDRTIQAVEETRGQLVMYDGKLAQTFYSSSCGGKTANVKYVWGSEFPYLVSVDDPYENPEEISNYNWSVEYSADEIKEFLTKREIDIGNVVNVEVIKEDNGTVYDVKITGESGEHHIKNDSVRGFFNLKSQYFTISSPSSPVTYPSVAVIGGNGISSVSLNNIAVFNGSVTSALCIISSQGIADIVPNEANTSDKFIFNGHGWGHRIGMSQWGAKGMADQGLSAYDILSHYFQGTYVDNSILG